VAMMPHQISPATTAPAKPPMMARPRLPGPASRSEYVAHAPGADDRVDHAAGGWPGAPHGAGGPCPAAPHDDGGGACGAAFHDGGGD
jgi:hypothetical protein